MNQEHIKVLVSRRMEQARDCLEDDYQRIDPVQPEEAAELIAVAERFVQSVREYLTRTGYLQ